MGLVSRSTMITKMQNFANFLRCVVHIIYKYRVSQKWRTNGALRCRRENARKMLKQFYWTYLLIWRSLKVALTRSIILKYTYV
jgi:hypothetical protein